MNTHAIEVQGLCKRFRRHNGNGLLWETIVNALKRRSGIDEAVASNKRTFWALNDVNLKAHRGEALGIIGPNGAGKSTMLKVLSRVLRPDAGSVQVNGRLSGLIEVGAGFHGDLTGRENIFVNGAILGMSRREVADKFDRIVEFAGIGDFLDMPVKRYSSGMYVRLGFSVAAHLEPDVLLVDEVLSVGDVTFKTRCMDAMRGFLRRGTCVLFVSHNLAAVKRFCDRVVLLDHGKVLCDGTPDSAIAEYSRLVSDMEEANPTGLEQSQIGGKAASNTGARITGVRFIDAGGEPARRFTAGERVRIELDYQLEPHARVEQLNFAISVNLFGAGLFYQFESLRDGLKLPATRGAGTVAVDLPQLCLGEGIYQIGVALADEKGFPEHDWHDRAYRIQVIADGLTEGAVYQPRQWVTLPPRTGEPAAELSTCTPCDDLTPAPAEVS